MTAFCFQGCCSALAETAKETYLAFPLGVFMMEVTFGVEVSNWIRKNGLVASSRGNNDVGRRQRFDAKVG